jgi:2-C-methyl-D-erythritol 4-phosphate cytidylyltransferase
LPTAAIVPAAGRGVRLGSQAPKALREVGGVPLLVHAVRALWQSRRVDLVVVAAPPGQAPSVQSLLRAAVDGLLLQVVEGGETRQQSVAAALAALPAEVDVVLVHDAARAFTPPEVVRRVVQAILDGAAAAVPVLPVTDTIKQVVDDGTVESTIDRTRLRSVQTPQGFRRDLLRRAHAAGHHGATVATDDAALVESLGVPVTVVEGSEEAFKVTRPFDLIVAEALLRSRQRG